jgi:hypothetical protein
MSAESELLRVYRDWRRLALAETKAIQTRNWVLLSDCHLAIKEYQSKVVGLTRQARAEWRRHGCNLVEKEANLKVLVVDLLEFARQNHFLAQSTLGAARQELHVLGEAGHNLKRLRRSYGYFPACSRSV